MVNFGQLTHSVQENCDISDAQFAGHYSLCTFLLKMREYYRWENDIPLTAQLSKDEIGAWLAQRERHWDSLTDRAFSPLPIEHRAIDPLDTAAINTLLTPHGLVYSAGYGLFQKPQFFLGALTKTEQHDGATFYVATCEYARELSAPPAMALGETVFIRQESLQRFLWEKIEEWRWKQNENAPLARAMACYPKETDLNRTLEHMTANETQALILHELGEIQAGRLLGPAWEEMLATLQRSKAEFLARAVRDHLADCLVTLPTLVQQDNRAALHFYFANFTGLRREIFPAALSTYQCWHNGQNKQEWRDLCERGVQLWRGAADRILATFAQDPGQTEATIEALFSTDAESISCAR